MIKNRFIGMTLVELLVGLVLLSIIVIGLSQIDLFSNAQVLRTDKQAVLQNELSLILNHMDKTGFRVIGNETITGNDTVVRRLDDGNSIDLGLYIDGDKNGKYTYTGGSPPIDQDHAVTYQLGIGPGGGGYPARYSLRYCPRCSNINDCRIDAKCNFPGWEVLGTHIRNFTISKPASSQLEDNYVYITMTACWDPDGTPDSCGGILNPQVTMHTVINFPMVSTN